MQLKSLKINNFQSIADVSFDFPAGLVLIDGWNEDTGSNNGVGKSALLNAITFAVYGQTPKDIKLEELVRDGAGNMLVDIELESKGKLIKISRSRNRTTGKIVLSIDGEIVDGLVKDIEARIPDLVGLSFEQFVQVVYIFQGANQRFISLNDTDKKKFLSTLLNLDVYDNAYRLAHSKLNTIELAISKATGNIESTERSIGLTGDQLAFARQEAEAFEGQKTTKVAELNNRVRTIKGNIKELELQKAQAAKSPELERLTIERGEIENRLTSYSKAQTALNRVESDLRMLVRNIISEESKLTAPVGKCSQCGQDLPGWDPAAHRKGIEITIEGLYKDKAHLENQKNQLDTIIAERPAVEKLKEDIINKIAAEKAKGPDRFDPLIAVNQGSLNTIAQEVIGLDDKTASLAKNVQRAQALLDQYRNALEDLKKALLGEEDTKKYILEIKKIFSPTGIRAYVFDGILKDLNVRIATYLDTLSGGTIRFEFTADDVKGKFGETCMYSGVERSIGALSGGEFRRLSLAVDLALADTVCSRMSVFPSVLFLDEAFDGLDVTGRETVMTLMNDLAMKRDAIYVVDHASEFKTAFSRVFKLIKKNGETRAE